MDPELKTQIAEELSVDPGELKRDTRLCDLENWDSTMLLSLMVILAEHLGREVIPAEVVRLKTFGNIEEFVREKSTAAVPADAAE